MTFDAQRRWIGALLKLVEEEAMVKLDQLREKVLTAMVSGRTGTSQAQQMLAECCSQFHCEADMSDDVDTLNDGLMELPPKKTASAGAEK